MRLFTKFLSISLCFIAFSLLFNYNLILRYDVKPGDQHEHEASMGFTMRSKEHGQLMKYRKLEQEIKETKEEKNQELKSKRDVATEEVGKNSNISHLQPEPLISSSPYKGETFSACLIWMDDYAKLSEWIAYNYQVLPLRHLVFFRDPDSVLDPIPILDRWRPYMNITYWTQKEDFMDTKTLIEFKHKNRSRESYIQTQKAFDIACLTHLNTQKRTWTLVYDTDEFWSLNNDVVPNTTSKMKQHGIAMDIIKRAQQKDLSVGVTEETAPKWFSSCIGIKRTEYTAFESLQEYVHKGVPSYLDPYRFVTLRFRHPGTRILRGKTLIDVSNYTWKHRHWKEMNPHSLIEECGKRSPWGHTGDLMLVNHYLGSMESYLRPSDQRNEVNRTALFFEKNKKHTRNKGMDKPHDEVRPWISGFVEYFGSETASILLEGAGLPYNKSSVLPTRDG
jgi:hypothetical protein